MLTVKTKKHRCCFFQRRLLIKILIWKHKWWFKWKKIRNKVLLSVFGRKMGFSENRIFQDQRNDLIIAKPNFPENTLVHINNGSGTLVKGGHALDLEYVVIGKILPLANLPPGIDLDKHDYKDNKVLIFTPHYDTANGLYRGLTKKLVYITLRGDLNENFYSYGFCKQNSKVLFCTVRQPLPNIFQCTAFKQHLSFLMSQNQENLKFSKMFMFLPQLLIEKRKFSSIMTMSIYVQLMWVMNNSNKWITIKISILLN